MTDSMPLIAAGGLVLLSHVVPSWPGVREKLRLRMGAVGYGIVHSLGSVVSLGAMVAAYRAVDVRTRVFTPLGDSDAIVVFLMPIAFALIALRLAAPVGAPSAPRNPTGIYRITRAPGALGVLLWALLHLQATGDTPRVIVFSVMAMIALFSMAKNDFLLRRADGDAARRFRHGTAIVPGWAILTGRTRFIASEWSDIKPWLAIVGGLIAYGVMLKLHPLIFSIDPLSLIEGI